MPNLNKVFLMGNVTRDPELRYVQSGMAVLDLGLAVNRRVKSGDGQWKDETAYIDVTVWGKQAENCAEYLAKGRLVLVEGHLRMDQWQDKKTGENRSRLRVTAENVQFLGAPTGRGPASDAVRPPRGSEEPASSEETGELSDDDIPF